MISIYNDKIRRLYVWYIGNVAPPIKIVIFLTQHCNLRCIFCDEKYDLRYKKELTEKQWLEIVKTGLQMGIREWIIVGGGEPMMRPQLALKIMKHIKKISGTYIELTTNGTLFTKDIIKTIVQQQIDKIYFSIDAPDPKIHDYLRGVQGSFQSAISAIKLFKFYKEKLEKLNPQLCIGSIMNKKNYNKLSKLVKLSHQIGCYDIDFNSLLIHENTRFKVKDIIISDFKRLQDNIIKAKMKARKLNVNLNVKSEIYNLCDMKREEEKISKYQNRKGFISSPCFEPWSGLLIDTEGYVGPCCCWSRGLTNMNVVTEGIARIWGGDCMNDIRRRISNNHLFNECGFCGLQDYSNKLREDLLLHINS